MASTLTSKNATISLKALEQGATDYVTKPSSTGGLISATDFQRELTGKVKSLGLAARNSAVQRGATAPRRLAAPPPHANKESGRAACRARRWQSVENLVGHDHLKKKNKIQDKKTQSH